MKILYVITKANWGGAQKYVFDLATAAHEKGFETIVAYGAPGELGKRLREQKIKTIEIASLRRDTDASADTSSFFELLSIFRAEKPDVVHLNSSKAGALGALAARVARINHIIFTAHGWAFNEERPFWQKILIACAHYVTVILSHTTICVSDATYRDARFMPLVQYKLKTIPLGIEEPVFKGRDEARGLLLKKGTNGFVIGMVCELHKNKGIFDALNAYKRALSSVEDALLVIMGEGGQRENVEKKIVELNLQRRVLLLGHVSDASTYLKAFDIFLLPSHTEALGYTLLEAGFAGLPCIGTDVGGIPEIITHKETGILVKKGDIEAIAGAIVELEQEPLFARRLGEELQKKVVTKFALQNMVEKTLLLYRS